MTSFLIRKRYRLKYYKKILNFQNFGFFILNTNLLQNDNLEYSKLSNHLLSLLLSKIDYNFYKGLNCYVNFSDFNKFIKNLSFLYSSKSPNILLLIKFYNYNFLPVFFFKNILIVLNNFNNFNIFFIYLYLYSLIYFLYKLFILPFLLFLKIVKKSL